MQTIQSSPAEDLAKFVVHSSGGHLMQAAMVTARKEFFSRGGAPTNDEFAAWIGEPMANGYPRVFKYMLPQYTRVVVAEGVLMLKESPKQKEARFEPVVDLPEQFPGVNPMKGKSKGDPDQCKSRNVLQNCPNVGAGDQYHIVEKGVGLNPGGVPYAPPSARSDFPLEAKMGRTTVLAKLGGCTDLNPKGDQQERSALPGSVGHHVRSLEDIHFPVDAITLKHDGTQLRVFTSKNAVIIQARNGLEQVALCSGAFLHSLDMTVEAVSKDRPVAHWDGKSIDELLSNSDIYITNVYRLNFDNIFGYAMIEECAGRLSYKGKKFKVAPTVWRRGEALPIYCHVESVIESLENAGYVHDGLVIHSSPEIYSQNLLKQNRTADVTKKLAQELGWPWPPGAKGVYEFSVRGMNGAGGVWPLRPRPDKDKPNLKENIISLMKSPDANMGLSYICSRLVEDSMDTLLTQGRALATGLRLKRETVDDLFKLCNAQDPEYGPLGFYRCEFMERWGNLLLDGPSDGGDLEELMKEIV